MSILSIKMSISSTWHTISPKTMRYNGTILILKMKIRSLDTGNIATELSHHGFRRVGDYGINLDVEPQQNLSFFLHNQPYRLAEGRLLLVHNGAIDLEIDLVEHHLLAGHIAVAMPDSLAMVSAFSSDTRISIMTFKHLPTDFLGQDGFVARCDKAALERIAAYCDLILHNLSLGGERTGILTRLFETLLMDVMTLRSDSSAMPVDQMMHRFLQLLAREGREKHPIAFYADRLCVSAGYVSMFVKRNSGLTVLQWIDRALVREAKVLLHHTQMPVSEIAEKLGFATPSFFIRFFRQQTGQTPLQYRKQG